MAKNKRKRQVLVLGAGGKVGRMLARAWQKHPSDWWLPIYQTGGAPFGSAIEWHPEDAPDLLPGVDAILALWGVTNSRAGDLADNTRLALRALELAGQLGAQRVLLCSSSAVYARSDKKHTERDAPAAPPTAYGQAKLNMERAVADWAARNPDGPEICILRMANVVGAESLFAALASGAPVTLDRFADGTGPARSYLTIGDLSRFVLALLDYPAPDLPPLLNVAGDHAIAMADLARAAGADIVWKAAPDKAVQRVELDTGQLSKIAGPSHSSHDADRAIADWRSWRSRA